MKKQTLKIKIIAVLTMLTIAILGTTEIGAVKIGCWFGLFVEFLALAKQFEKDLQNDQRKGQKIIYNNYGEKEWQKHFGNRKKSRQEH